MVSKRLAASLSILLATAALSPLPSMAQAVPDHTGWVTDQTGDLTDDQVLALDAKLGGLQDSIPGHPQVAELIVPSLPSDTSIKDFATRTFQTWGVGQRGLNNGVLLVLAMKERQDYIERGTGLGRVLPDAKIRAILDDMQSDLRSGNLYGGLGLAADEIGANLQAHALLVSALKLVALLAVAGALGSVPVVLLWRKRRRRLEWEEQRTAQREARTIGLYRYRPEHDKRAAGRPASQSRPAYRPASTVSSRSPASSYNPVLMPVIIDTSPSSPAPPSPAPDTSSTWSGGGGFDSGGGSFGGGDAGGGAGGSW